MNKFLNQIYFKNKKFFILRDDLISGFNGNKARKLEFFLQADLSKFKAIVSFGSSQSNAMAALSLFAKKRKLKFYYFTKHLNSFLIQNQVGNYHFAICNGMQILPLYKMNDFINDKTLFIPEGIACKEAELGFISQAKLIRQLMKEFNLEFDIFLPSATGTSAAFLAKHLKECNVFTTPCVGSVQYLQEKIYSLDKNSQVKILPPYIKAYFADLKREFYDIYLELKEQTGIEFELLYDPQGWLTMLANLNVFSKEILYIHQGGLEGVASQLQRYKRKFL